MMQLDQLAIVTLVLAFVGGVFNAGMSWQRLNTHEKNIDDLAGTVRTFHEKVDELKGMIRGDSD